LNIDGRRGHEILVAVDGGASTSAHGVFSLRGEELVRLRKPHGPFVDAFFEGGSGNRMFSFGCARRGLVIQGGGTQDGARYSGSRDFYRFSETTFRFTGLRRYRNLAYARYRRFPEMSARPFARCAR
jgi:hypothetical protein